MDIETLIPYILLCLILVISPGPNTFLIFNTASTVGKKDSLLKIFGLVVATYFHGLLSLFGISLILLNSALAFTIVKLLGALYLLYLGLKFIWQSWFFVKKSRNSINIRKLPSIKSFMVGFVTQILNPKVSVFYIAAFPQFIKFDSENHYLQGLLLISIHALTIALWFIAMTFFVTRFTSSNDKLNRIISFASGVLLVYFAIILGLQPLPTMN